MGRIYDALKKAEAERLHSPEGEKVLLGSVTPQMHHNRGPHTRSVFPTEVVEEPVPEPAEIDLQPGPDSRLYSQRKDGTLGVHQLRMLQVDLLELQRRRPFKRLLITSATSGEGKTHVAANLAWALASEGDRKVLLIDADIRNSSLHSVCGIANDYGLKDLLSNGGDSWRALRKVKRTNLYLMTGGTAAYETIGPSGLSRLQSVLEEFAPSFDLVLLDSAPLLGGVDTKLLSAVADAVLLVVRAGTTSRDLVLQAQELLDPQNILGVVLNGLDSNFASFANYYNHGSRSPNDGAGNGASVRSARR